ncbi:orotate phosphoribosyltransferase [Lactobacillus sp. YT155]|uniref:orotate phosphoribosyltransferase n=1 Tax=Lactobacillus sp. YT155 TaxID=3060955 RepID=UPI00265FC9D2|nr:orotate phosphoribosyltransferase [Lactobacillus sp. YT155]MDO1604918.1 orotate phosphoribosyltransferase [Lactobacillus sp. YT155]
MYTSQKLIQDLLKIKAVTLSPDQPYVWASGLQAPIYTDNRLTFGHTEVRQNIAKLMASIIRKNYPEVTVICGVATAGIPHATAVANILNLPLSYVRPQPKDHGRGKQIEGCVTADDKVVVIDDLISTGGSVLKAVEVVRRTGAQVLGTTAIFSYNLPLADANFSKHNTQLISLTNFHELIQEAKDSKYINDYELLLLRRWYQELKGLVS